MDLKNIRYVTINRSCHIPQVFRYDDWNCNYCSNDNEYYQPYKDKDHISIQTWFEDVLSANPLTPTYGWYTENTNNWYIRIRVYDLSGNLISDDPDDFVVIGCCGSVDNLSFQNVVLNVDKANLDVDCFYFEFQVKTSANTYEYYKTEAYKRVICEETFTIQGNFNGFDSGCSYYYFDSSDESAYFAFEKSVNKYNYPYAHIDYYRVLGVYEQTGTTNDCVMLEDGTMSQVKASTLRKNIYRLRTKGIPPYIAEKMCNSITGYSFIIDDCIECLCHAGFQKNNETGLMWYIDTEIQQIAAQVNHNNCE